MKNIVKWGTGAGRENWVDNTYTSGSPLSLSGASGVSAPIILPNDGLGALTSTDYTPLDLVANGTTLYDPTGGGAGQGIVTGRTGDSLIVGVEFKAVPTSPSTNSVKVYIDIGGAVGALYEESFTFPKGQGVERPVLYSPTVYTLDTWATNGGTVYVQADGTLDIYNIRFIIYRLMRGDLFAPD